MRERGILLERPWKSVCIGKQLKQTSVGWIHPKEQTVRSKQAEAVMKNMNATRTHHYAGEREP